MIRRVLGRVLFALIAVTTAWFFAVATFAWIVGPVQLCDATFQATLCSALGVQ